jgi:hypothetical protein
LLGAVGCAPAKPTPHTGHATGVLHQAVNGGWRSEWRRADTKAEATAERSEPAKNCVCGWTFRADTETGEAHTTSRG